ncbi:MAG: B12-binding domain-containing radical SAM protein, partial [Candidatus Helarchaeales archaeon]
DSESTLNMKRIERICELIQEHGYEKKWKSCQGRVDDVIRYPQIVEKMADAGWKMMFIGIESIHQKSLDTIGKRITVNQIKHAVKILHDLGITIFGSIIIGNLGETAEDVKKTIQFAQDLDIDIMQFTPLTPYPATKLYEQASANGWISDYNFENWNLVKPIMRTDKLTAEEIHELEKFAYRDFYMSFRRKRHKFFFFRAVRRFTPNPRFWWFWKMATPFVMGIMRNWRAFAEDLTSKEYLLKRQLKEKKKQEKKLKKKQKKIQKLEEKNKMDGKESNENPPDQSGIQHWNEPRHQEPATRTQESRRNRARSRSKNS